VDWYFFVARNAPCGNHQIKQPLPRERGEEELTVNLDLINVVENLLLLVEGYCGSLLPPLASRAVGWRKPTRAPRVELINNREHYTFVVVEVDFNRFLVSTENVPRLFLGPICLSQDAMWNLNLRLFEP
jgi:hypothetical protein